MPVFSKIVGDVQCSDFVHPWCNSCLKTFLILWKIGFRESVKVYTTFYAISSLISRKTTNYYFSKFPVDILRSSLFLSLNGALFSIFICLIRLIQKFNILSIAYVPSFFASGIALSFERKSRRQQLAVYMVNIVCSHFYLHILYFLLSTKALQTIYLMLKNRGYVSTVKNGEVLLFSAAAAGILFLFTTKKTPAYLTKFLGFLFGYSEIEGSDEKTDDKNKIESSKIVHIKLQLSSAINKMCSILHGKLKLSFKSSACRHDFSCGQYMFSGFYKPFVIGMLIEFGINFIKNIRSPLKFAATLRKIKTYNLAMFIGSFSVIFRAVQCIQRKLFNGYKPTYAIISAFIAGLTNKFYPSVSISMYAITKLVELCFRSYCSDIVSENFNTPFIIFLYSISTAIVFNAAILEPENVPKTYVKFLSKMTQNRINGINRAYLP